MSIFSDARFRGYSLSAGHPVALLDLSYDDPSGLYAAASGSFVANDGVHPLGLQLNGGYARRVAPGLTLDVGAIHSAYSHYGSRGSASYTEVYAGATYKFLSGRVAYSPHYFGKGNRTIYAELDANVSPARKLRLNGHVGLLAPLDYREQGFRFRTQYDWRIGASREVGPLSLHVNLSGGGPDRDYYRGHWRGRTALVLGASLPL